MYTYKYCARIGIGIGIHCRTHKLHCFKLEPLKLWIAKIRSCFKGLPMAHLQPLCGGGAGATDGHLGPQGASPAAEEKIPLKFN